MTRFVRIALLGLGLSVVNPVISAHAEPTIWTSSWHDCDVNLAASVLEQAYKGAGEDLENLAASVNYPTDATAELIVTLDKQGKLSPAHPTEFQQTVVAAVKAAKTK